MLRFITLVFALALPLQAFGPSANAMGSGPPPALLANPDYVQAEKLIKEWKYAEAIPLLEKVVKEYQGEMFLMLDDLKSAESNLAKLDKACFFGCDEYTDLKKAVADYKKRKGITS